MKGISMKTEYVQIGTAPGVLYGEPANQGYLFLHGQMGRKEEAEAFARVACPKGYQVLSVDLPGHGERQGRDEELTPWAAVPDIRAALDWARCRWRSVSLRANSIGAYFAMLAFAAPDRALLVSPILDMEGLILTMMGWAGACPVRILYGSRDNMTSRRTMDEFVRRHGAKLTVMEGGEHWFHTPEQSAVLQKWEETET